MIELWVIKTTTAVEDVPITIYRESEPDLGYRFRRVLTETTLRCKLVSGWVGTPMIYRFTAALYDMCDEAHEEEFPAERGGQYQGKCVHTFTGAFYPPEEVSGSYYLEEEALIHAISLRRKLGKEFANFRLAIVSIMEEKKQ